MSKLVTMMTQESFYHEKLTESEACKKINSIYSDFEDLLNSELDEDIDHDDVNSENNLRVKYAVKLSRRYFKESNLTEITSSVKRAIILELNLLRLVNYQTTSLKESLVFKLAKILDVEELVVNDLKELAISISEVLKKSLEIINE